MNLMKKFCTRRAGVFGWLGIGAVVLLFALPLSLRADDDNKRDRSGKPDRSAKPLGEKKMYLYKDMKITFIGGKVNDVQ
jgi:hypothetical protein